MDAPSPRRAGDILFGKIDDMRSRVAAATDAARKYLFSIQDDKGYWCGELEADTTLASDYILLHALLGTGDPEKLRKATNWILAHQNEDGGWGIYHGAPSHVSASVKAYFGLKLAGFTADHPALVRARKKILDLGGVTEVNTFTKIYLCFFGQYDYETVPAVPPEIVLFPRWFWFNLYEISSWSRGILVPLSIAYAKKPFKKIPDEQGIAELFRPGTHNRRGMRLKWDTTRSRELDTKSPGAPPLPRTPLAGQGGKTNFLRWKFSWRNFFLVLNAMTHWFERVHVRPLRSLALKYAEKWMLARFEMSDGLGAIYPAMMNSIIALRCLGYSLDDPQMIRALDEFEALGIEDAEADTFRMQPCKPPVWDTAYAAFALAECGVAATDSRLVASADWLLSKEVRHKGDWAEKVRNVEPGGWYFEFNNEFYPDVDDSAMVLLALNRIENPRERYQHQVVQRAITWIKAMQCKEGGWASFDRDNTKMVFQYIPFADHNAMLDPPTVDITGRVLEMFASFGYSREEKFIQRAIAFIRKHQESDGSWFGRWGVNYIYGTMQVLRGLEAIGVDHHEPYIQHAAEWIRMFQNPDGGWGETCGSYDDPNTKGIGPSTPSQTAWAVLGLLAAGDNRSDSVARGVAWLLKMQQKDGSWKCPDFTGTGFPRVFYLKYHLYEDYFPLLALTTYAKSQSSEAGN